MSRAGDQPAACALAAPTPTTTDRTASIAHTWRFITTSGLELQRGRARWAQLDSLDRTRACWTARIVITQRGSALRDICPEAGELHRGVAHITREVRRLLSEFAK